MRAKVQGSGQRSRFFHLGKLNRKLHAGCERLAFHFPFGTNSITQILEIHKTKTGDKSKNETVNLNG